MRLSIWQFVLVVVVIAAAVFFYHVWWSNQDRVEWIDRLNEAIFHREAEDVKKKEEEPPPRNPEGWQR